MKIICLAENTSLRPDLGCEHGLSFYIETGGRRLLFDMGAGKLFLENAKVLGVDISSVDLAVISHGHNDHGGGLPVFLSVNDKAKVYVRREAFEEHYSQRKDGVHNIGLDRQYMTHPQIVLVDETDLAAEDGIRLFAGVKKDRMFPYSNSNLREKDGDEYVPDRFFHEQNMVLTENGKMVLFAGCAHNGILNIMDRCIEVMGREPDLVIGGFHLKSPAVGSVEPEYLATLAGELKKYKSRFVTCHCTGEECASALHEIMGDQLSSTGSGGVITDAEI